MLVQSLVSLLVLADLSNMGSSTGLITGAVKGVSAVVITGAITNHATGLNTEESTMSTQRC